VRPIETYGEGAAVAEVRSLVLRDGHELIAFRHPLGFAHGAIKPIEDCLPIGFRLSGTQ
jgi:hypothetical protein